MERHKPVFDATNFRLPKVPLALFSIDSSFRTSMRATTVGNRCKIQRQKSNNNWVNPIFGFEAIFGWRLGKMVGERWSATNLVL